MFSLEETFELLAEAGFDGVELMITQDRMSQDPHRMAAVARRFGLPVPAVHGPFLLATWLVYGTDPKGKLDRCVEFAETAGVSTIVIHPPYRWQVGYAGWLPWRITEIRQQTGITVAVENMFPVWMNGRRLQFHNGIEPQELEKFPYVTLDLSHLAVAGIDILDDGVLPVETFLKGLMTSGFPGGITLELDVRPLADDRPGLLEFLRSNVGAARRYLEAGAARAVEPADPVGR